MSRTADIKRWAPGALAVVAGGLVLTGVLFTWKTLAGSGAHTRAGTADPGAGVRVAVDPAGQAPSTAPTAPSMEHGAKPPSAFGYPQFPDAFDFHSMEAKAKSGRTPIGSSAFLARKAHAAEIAQYYLLELGKNGWELVWQREAKIHPNNDPARAPMTGTRLRWLDRTHRKQLTLLALDDPQAKHSAQAVVSWAALPGRTRAGATGG